MKILRPWISVLVVLIFLLSIAIAFAEETTNEKATETVEVIATDGETKVETVESIDVQGEKEKNIVTEVHI